MYKTHKILVEKLSKPTINIKISPLFFSSRMVLTATKWDDPQKIQIIVIYLNYQSESIHLFEPGIHLKLFGFWIWKFEYFRGKGENQPIQFSSIRSCFLPCHRFYVKFFIFEMIFLYKQWNLRFIAFDFYCSYLILQS